MSGQPLNSSTFATGRFAPHGNSVVRAAGKVIEVTTEGPFNLEGIQAINRTRMELLQTMLPSGPYAYLNTWRGSVMMSQACVDEYLRGLVEAYQDRHPAPVAVVWIAPPGVDGAEIMEPLLAPGFAAVGIAFRIFQDQLAAQAWLDQLLQSQ